MDVTLSRFSKAYVSGITLCFVELSLARNVPL